MTNPRQCNKFNDLALYLLPKPRYIYWGKLRGGLFCTLFSAKQQQQVYKLIEFEGIGINLN